jgi:hypothetical protein
MKVDIEGNPLRKATVDYSQNAILQALIGSTKQQRSSWIDNNVTNIAEAQELLKHYADAIVYILRKI